MDRWIFGYGSLIFRPEFAFRTREAGRVAGYSRRFFQGSPDHRGVPGSPGRVVTLLADPAGECWGAAYQLSPEVFDGVVEALDRREIAGYEQRLLRVALRSGAAVEALTYIATPSNPNYLGPLSAEGIAEHARRAAGRSGTNADYVRELSRALRELDVADPHVFEVERWLDARVAALPDHRAPDHRAPDYGAPDKIT